MRHSIKALTIISLFYTLLKSALVLPDPLNARLHHHIKGETKTTRFNSGDNNLKTGMTVTLNGAVANRTPVAVAPDSTSATLCRVKGIALSAASAPHLGDATDVTLGREFDVITEGPVEGYEGLTVGETYYAIGTTGQIVLFADIPAGGANYIVPVGYAMSPTKLYFQLPQPVTIIGTFELKA